MDYNAPEKFGPKRIQVCSGNCRTKYYHDLKKKRQIDEAINKNDFARIIYKIDDVIRLGYKVIICKPVILVR